MAKRSFVRGNEAQWFVLFSRYPAHESTRQKYAGQDNVMFVTLDDLYGSV